MKDDEESAGAEQGTDRPLPAGWGWRPSGIDKSGRSLLYRDGGNGHDFIASTYPNGQWWIFREHCDEDAPPLDGGIASPRPGESLLAAAQREAVAALWARDGFGVGRVYGARLSLGIREASHYVASRRLLALPGLGVPGLWRVTAAREVEGLTEIDAVRAPFDTQAEADAARAHVTGAADADRSQAEPASWNWCWPCNQAVDIDDDTHEGSRVRCLGCRAWHVVCRDGDGAWSLESEAEHDADAADAARGTAKDAAPLTHALDAEGNALCPYDPERLAYVSQRPKRVTCPTCREKTAEPAPREPSAPDELARLLPGLAHDLDMVTDLRFESQRSTPIQRVARACSLLLDERERVSAAMRPYHAPTRDEGSYERTLSRVLAELDRLRADDGARLSGIVAKNRELTDALGHAEEDRDALRARVAELEAAPPPGTVATPERAIPLSDFIEAAREVIDGAPMSDRSGRTDGDRIAKMARALVSYESAEETHEPAPSREPSAPTDGELARLLPGLAEDVARVRRTDFGSPDSVSASIDRLARACELLLDERERMTRDAREHATLHSLALGREGAKLAEIGELRARVAELEAQVAPPRMAWTCTTCGVSGTTEMLADDGSGPVCPECRQARHLCMHEPAGHRVAALLRAMDDAAKDAVEETDDRPDHVRTGRPFAYVEGLREATRLVREHLDAPSPEDFAKLPRLSDAEIQTALNKGRSEAFPAHHPFAAHLTAPSPLDLAVAEVVASPLSDHAAIEINGADDAIEVIGELHAEREADTDRSLLLSIARVALAGMLACDAAKGGSK